MTRIDLKTDICADRRICFDLSRSIDLHQFTTKETNEKAIDGKTSGLISEGEWVKWEATHFFIRQTMTVRITSVKNYDSFNDEMIEGPFKWMTHLHTFETKGDCTLLTDVFEYEVPYGIAGRIFDVVFLKRHMTKLLQTRNNIIREVAESGKWKTFLNQSYV